jgi:hypothetical protein
MSNNLTTIYIDLSDRTWMLGHGRFKHPLIELAWDFDWLRDGVQREEHQPSIFTCQLCSEPKEKRNNIELNCRHKFCAMCVLNKLFVRNKDSVPSCAECQTPITSINIRNNVASNVVFI